MNVSLRLCRENKQDCFACEYGRCWALGDTRFDGGCTFYCNAEEANKRKEDAKQKLFDKGLSDLWGMYNKNNH